MLGDLAASWLNGSKSYIAVKLDNQITALLRITNGVEVSNFHIPAHQSVGCMVCGSAATVCLKTLVAHDDRLCHAVSAISPSTSQ